MQINSCSSQLVLNVPKIHSHKNYKKFNLKDRIQSWLNEKINPNLEVHGGSIKFVKINKDGYVFLQFFGRCNGCAMSNFTLRSFIEKKILKKFPNINGIKDITDHIQGTHSYY
ncbi:NifU family protein [Buchnera aphidicola (Chaitoregma tattakana)]|uniref:NifU family protein n=1 Tax=Buchnera aphidicola TaxID=9 RepID=UPI0031B81686